MRVFAVTFVTTSDLLKTGMLFLSAQKFNFLDNAKYDYAVVQIIS
jgi:hypothetical protein